MSDIKHDAEAEYLSLYLVNGKYYLSLGDVIERVPAKYGQGYNFTGEYEIELLKDVSDGGFDVAKNGKLTLNLNGHNYNINSTVGSTGTTTNGIHPLGNSEITIKNGTISSNVGKMIVNSYGKFVAENVIFDCSQMSLSHYGTTGSFDPINGKYKEYSGLESCIFVCNGGGTMELTDCKIIMPSNSTKGVAIDGELTLNNTRVEGYLSVNRGGILKVDNTSICTKEIQTYFNGESVTSTKEGNYTIYTNNAA